MSKERSVEQVCQTNVRVTGPELKRWREEGWSGVVVVVGHFVESDRALHTSHQSDQSEQRSVLYRIGPLHAATSNG